MTSSARIVPLSLVILVFVCGSARTQALPANESAAVEFFEKKIRPLLADNCYSCHSADTNSQGGLRLDDRNGMIHGGGRGPAIVPGQPEKSLLLRAVRQTDEKLKMPKGKHLTDEQIADLEKWIKDGAAWPRVEVPSSIGKPNPKFDLLRKEHWAWQPLRVAKVPLVTDAAWPLADIDRFILASLESKELKPVGDANRLALIRRVTFDLTGLPPTIAESEAFVNDKAPDAFEKLVDRLLAAPAFGERWGRHWLDVARYGESTGSARNLPYPHAWRYRDYVIAAFNNDKPYDRFIREQIAGDLLPIPPSPPWQGGEHGSAPPWQGGEHGSAPPWQGGERGGSSVRDEQLIATGFLALGVKDVNQRFQVRFIMDNIDEQIDTVSRAFLALTVSCARCHDHKFDPIPVTDYYALAGIFHSTEQCAGLRNKMGGGGLDYYDTAKLVHLGHEPWPQPGSPEKVGQLKKELAQTRKELEAIRDKPEGKASGADGRPRQQVLQQKVNLLQDQLFALNDPASSGQVALGLREAATIGDTEIRIRGEAEKIGPSVPRGFLSLVNVPSAPKIDGRHSGRLELAQWLTNPDNPLTSRVMVNRVWHHLFSQGLVSSVDNFGVTGAQPSHPELLDYLAARFVRDGWSIKKLIRSIVLSRAYQLSAEASTANLAVDPANRLIWRHAPRRLDAEELRDAALAASGELDLSRFVASPVKNFKVIEMTNNGAEARLIDNAAFTSRHRSVYLPLVRTLTPRSLEVFDFADQGMVTGSRDSTTVATQALYLLNDPFVRQRSLTLAEKLLHQTDLDDSGRINLAYRLTLSRPATDKEIERVHNYLADYEAAAHAVSKPALPTKPKKVDQGKDEAAPPNPHAAAWMSFCQALLASAEFRYLK